MHPQPANSSQWLDPMDMQYIRNARIGTIYLWGDCATIGIVVTRANDVMAGSIKSTSGESA